MRDVIRASALDGYSELFRELGGTPEPILAAAHLRPELLGSTEAFIPYRSMIKVIEQAAAELECPDFSMRLASRQSIQIMGPIALIARHSSTVRSALEGIAKYLSSFTDAARFDINDDAEGHTMLRFDVLVPGVSSHAQMNQLTLGVALGILRLLMGGGSYLVLVSVPHARPAHADLYESFFNCRVRFDSEYAGVLLRTASLERRLSSHDPYVREHVARFLDQEAPADDDLVTQIRHLIGRTLSTGHADTVTIAAHLGLHARTFQRRLAAHDETFESLLDDVRREKANIYLTESGLALGQIAATLGYSQQSCFSRASARWFGQSPSAVRRAARAERAATAT